MSDLIDRQMAIDTIAKLPAIHGSEGSWVNMGEAIEKLKSMPSAQPEPCDDPRADVYYLAEKIGIHRLYALVVELRGEPEPCEDAVSREAVLDMLHQECSSMVENFMKEKINAMPSVAAKQSEIVHCRECKHLIDHRCRKIRTLDDWRKPDDFCSYAERREEGGE